MIGWVIFDRHCYIFWVTNNLSLTIGAPLGDYSTQIYQRRFSLTQLFATQILQTIYSYYCILSIEILQLWTTVKTTIGNYILFNTFQGTTIVNQIDLRPDSRTTTINQKNIKYFYIFEGVCFYICFSHRVFDMLIPLKIIKKRLHIMTHHVGFFSNHPPMYTNKIR